MNSRLAFGVLLLAGALSLPAGAAPAGTTSAMSMEGPEQQLLARRGGGGGRGGGRSGSRGSSGRTGFSRSGGQLNRGSSRPSGGWSNKVDASRTRPSVDRSPGTRPVNRSGSRTADRNRSRDINRRVDRRTDVDWNRRVNINNVNVRPGWARPGWGVARPWNTGWYGGWSDPPWGWWAARTATWGISTLATASVINNAVDNAVASNTPTIVVPNTSYQLLYGSVEPAGSSAVSFAVTADGSTYQLTADCDSGLLDGRPPDSAAEAELLNAACQVAFGSV